ncbi:MAG: hypothetical protein ACI87E_001838 [Mariniblastus sp.]|jgi:hypothetical protein
MKILKKLLGLNTRSVSGRWQGHYLQHGALHRIIADFDQQGVKLDGAMIDIDNTKLQRLNEVALQEGLSPATIAEMEGQIRDLIPQAGNDPIFVHSTLPKSSKLEGDLVGNRITFEKTYHGETVLEYSIGSQAISYSDPTQCVDYDGTLSPDGKNISGAWSITQIDDPLNFIEGVFELNRIPDDQH